MVKFVGQIIRDFNKIVETNLSLNFRNLLLPKFLSDGLEGIKWNFFNEYNISSHILPSKRVIGVAVNYGKNSKIFSYSNHIYIIDGNLLSKDCIDESYTSCTEHTVKEIDEILDTDFEKISEILSKVISPFAMAIINENNVILARDQMGTKKLWISFDGETWHFGSATHIPYFLKKVEYVPPGSYVILYKDHYETTKYQMLITNKIEYNEEKKDLDKKIAELIVESVKERVYNKRIAISFSGGLDSSLLAYIAKDYAKEMLLVTTTFGNMKDKSNAKSAANILDLPIEFIDVTNQKIVDIVPRILGICGEISKMDVEIALPFYVTAEYIKGRFHNVMMGQGADELFGGYNKYQELVINGKSDDAHKLMHEDFTKLRTFDIGRDENIMHAHGLNLILPYLDLELASYVMDLPIDFKVTQNERKGILRHAAISLKFPVDIALRKKLATQYGSGSHRALNKIIKQSGLKDFENFNEIIKAVLAIFNIRTYPKLSEKTKSYTIIKEAYELNQEFEDKFQKIKI